MARAQSPLGDNGLRPATVFTRCPRLLGFVLKWWHRSRHPVIYLAPIEDGKIDVSNIPGGTYVWVPYHKLKEPQP